MGFTEMQINDPNKNKTKKQHFYCIESCSESNNIINVHEAKLTPKYTKVMLKLISIYIQIDRQIDMEEKG